MARTAMDPWYKCSINIMLNTPVFSAEVTYLPSWNWVFTEILT